jgi:hypothetical protein
MSSELSELLWVLGMKNHLPSDATLFIVVLGENAIHLELSFVHDVINLLLDGCFFEHLLNFTDIEEDN